MSESDISESTSFSLKGKVTVFNNCWSSTSSHLFYELEKGYGADESASIMSVKAKPHGEGKAVRQKESETPDEFMEPSFLPCP